MQSGSAAVAAAKRLPAASVQAKVGADDDRAVILLARDMVLDGHRGREQRA